MSGDKDTVGEQRICWNCHELAPQLPQRYHGRYETPDGDAYVADSETYCHPECAELLIDAIERGAQTVQLGDFA